MRKSQKQAKNKSFLEPTRSAGNSSAVSVSETWRSFEFGCGVETIHSGTPGAAAVSALVSALAVGLRLRGKRKGKKMRHATDAFKMQGRSELQCGSY